MWLRLVHSAGHARPGLRRRWEPRQLAQLGRLWTQGVSPPALAPCLLPSGQGAAGRGAPQRPATPSPSEPGDGRGVRRVASLEIRSWTGGREVRLELRRTVGATGRISAVSPAERCASLSCPSGPAGSAGLKWVRGAYATSSPTYTRAAPRPHRCLATAAAANKGCLSQKGEGEGSRPQTRSHLFFPPAPFAAMIPPGGGGAGQGWGADAD